MDTICETHKVLNDSSTVLMAIVEEPISTEIKDNMMIMNRHWEDVQSRVDALMKRHSVERAREEYRGVLTALKKWIVDTEQLLNNQCEPTAVALSTYHITLQVERLKIVLFFSRCRFNMTNSYIKIWD